MQHIKDSLRINTLLQIPCVQCRIHLILSSVETTLKSTSWSTELQYSHSLRTLQLTQKTRTRKRGKKTFCTNKTYFQYYIFISQGLHSPGHLPMLWSHNSTLTDCMGCSFILWLLTLFFQWFWLVFFPKIKRGYFRVFL